MADSLALEVMLNAASGPLTLLEIADGLGTTHAAITAVARLTELGLVDQYEDLVFPSLTARHANERGAEPI